MKGYESEYLDLYSYITNFKNSTVLDAKPIGDLLMTSKNPQEIIKKFKNLINDDILNEILIRIAFNNGSPEKAIEKLGIKDLVDRFYATAFFSEIESIFGIFQYDPKKIDGVLFNDFLKKNSKFNKILARFYLFSSDPKNIINQYGESFLIELKDMGEFFFDSIHRKIHNYGGNIKIDDILVFLKDNKNFLKFINEQYSDMFYRLQLFNNPMLMYSLLDDRKKKEINDMFQHGDESYFNTYLQYTSGNKSDMIKFMLQFPKFITKIVDYKLMIEIFKIIDDKDYFINRLLNNQDFVSKLDTNIIKLMFEHYSDRDRLYQIIRKLRRDISLKNLS